MQPDVGDKNTENEVVEDFDDDAAEATVVMSEDSFDDSGISMEVNVESLVKELDRSNVDELARKKEVRRKLEELAEEQSFEDTYAVEFDND
ncbi:MAG: hypothetical protein GXP15_17340 [Gammaproteobacteria bacterium]|nr:hypothetical protein [Gammaproteobacteria bacterium]